MMELKKIYTAHFPKKGFKALTIFPFVYIIKIVICKFDSDRAYFSISFEQEAYAGQNKFSYNDTRKHYAWIKYLFTLKPKKI